MPPYFIISTIREFVNFLIKFDSGFDLFILNAVTIREFQNLIRELYFNKDQTRGVDGTYRWLCEELGELARALRHNQVPALQEEFADVFAWLVSLASLTGIDLEQACEKYRNGCPKCHSLPCRCKETARISTDEK